MPPPDDPVEPPSAFGWLPMDDIHEVFRTRGGFSEVLPAAAAGLTSLSRLWIDVRVFSLELPLLAGSAKRIAAAATPPTSEDDPPEDDPIDDTDTDRSCTSYSDSCELVLISRLDKLLFFTFNRLAFTNRLGGGSLFVGFVGGSCCDCCCFCGCCC